MTDLQNRSVAVSISDAPDRRRLGFPEREVERTLFSLCTAVVRAGATILYGGNLDTTQFTFKIFRHLVGAYAGAGSIPFEQFVGEPILRDTSFDDWMGVLAQTGGTTRTFVMLGRDPLPIRLGDRGLVIDPTDSKRADIADASEFAEWLATTPATPRAQAYTWMREAMTARMDARVAMGGRMGIKDISDDQYQGKMPGIAEEVILALKSGKLTICLAAYGGVTRDLAIALKLMSVDDRVPRGEQQEGYETNVTQETEALAGQIPESLRPLLSAIASSDRSEQLGLDVVKVLGEWLGPKSV